LIGCENALSQKRRKIKRNSKRKCHIFDSIKPKQQTALSSTFAPSSSIIPYEFPIEKKKLQTYFLMRKKGPAFNVTNIFDITIVHRL